MLFFAKTLRYIGACRVRFSNVACVSVRSVSASATDFTVLADAAFAFEDVSVLEFVVVFGCLDFFPCGA